MIFFKTKTFQSFPVSTNRIRRYILPKQTGLAFILILFFMLIGSVNYNNNLGFILTFLLSSMAFVSMIHTNRNLSSIKIISVNSKPVFAGETAVIKILATAESGPRFAVTFNLPGGKSDSIDFHNNHVSTININIKTDKRGILNPWPLTIKSEFPFGMFYTFTTLGFDKRLLVYPKPLPMDVKTEQTPSGSYDEGSTEVSGIDDFKGLKGFQPGDSIKRISWKIFSRGMGVYVKEFVGQSGSEILMDWDKIKTVDREKKIAALCHLILTASKSGVTFGLKIPGLSINPSSGEPHKHECLTAIALLP